MATLVVFSVGPMHNSREPVRIAPSHSNGVPSCRKEVLSGTPKPVPDPSSLQSSTSGFGSLWKGLWRPILSIFRRQVQMRCSPRARDLCVQLWRRMAHGTVGLLLGAMLFHGVAVVYGAPLLSNVTQTHLWAWLMSALVIQPTACVLGPDATAWRRLYARCSPTTTSELALCIPAHGSNPPT